MRAFHVITKSSFLVQNGTNSEHRDQTMLQVIAYKRLLTTMGGIILSVAVVAYERSEGYIQRIDFTLFTPLIYVTYTSLQLNVHVNVHFIRKSIQSVLTFVYQDLVLNCSPFGIRKKMVSLLNCSLSSLFKIYIYATLMPPNGVDILLSRPGLQLLLTV